MKRITDTYVTIIFILCLILAMGPAALAAPNDGASEPAAPPAVAPSQPAEDYRPDGMLDGDVIEQLDEELSAYLIGTGEPIAVDKDLRNILLVGLDARPGETRSRSDTVIVLTIDTRQGAIRMTSFLRDMYVSIPGHGHNRINTAWVYGGFPLLRDTIEENFGLRVDEYVAVDLTLLTEIFDQLGGLTLDIVSEKQLSAINGVIDGYNYQFGLEANSDFLTHTGVQQLNGKQVQAYARYRRGESDFQRSERQREVLWKAFGKLKDMSLAGLSHLAGTIISRLDTSLTLSDVIALIPTMLSLRDAAFEQLQLPYDGEYQATTVSGMDVLVPSLSASQIRLERFINGGGSE